MPYNGQVTAQMAEQSRQAKLGIARGRRVPEFLGVLQKAKDAEKYYIINVGPWPEKVNTGSTGWFFIPACPRDKEYVVAEQVIEGIVDELIPKDEFEYTRLMTDGWHHACEIVGDGRGRDPSQSLRHKGIFPSKTPTPSKADLAEAKKRLHARCSEYVREARDTFAQDRRTFNLIVKPFKHYVAAEILGLNAEPWMVDTTPKQSTKCPFCRASLDADAIICINCKEVVDPVGHARLLQARQQILDESMKPPEPPKAPQQRPQRG